MTSRYLVALALASGLHKLHQKHIIHGDINPKNIIIKQTRGGKLIASYIDFDFVHPLPANEDGININGKRSVVKETLAPEVKETKKLTFNTDIYALGLILEKLGLFDLTSVTKTDYPDNRYSLPQILHEILIKLVCIHYREESQFKSAIREGFHLIKQSEPQLLEKFESIEAFIEGQRAYELLTASNKENHSSENKAQSKKNGGYVDSIDGLDISFREKLIFRDNHRPK